MFCKIEALNYRSLRYISRDLNNFQILVGPNASGKTSFLDAFSFLSDVVRLGPQDAIRKRSQNYKELLWKGEGNVFSLAVEMAIPQKISEQINRFGNYRYEISIGEISADEIGIISETLWHKPLSVPTKRQISIFPDPMQGPNSITTRQKRGWKMVANKVQGRNDNFYPETKGYKPSYRLGPQKSTLGNLLEDDKNFPMATYFKRTITEGIKTLVLNSESMRRPSPPGMPSQFKTDGSNLPWVIEKLKVEANEQFKRWIEHLQAALPDLIDIKTIQREEDKHRYIVITYKNGIAVPSWLVSDGTLRMMALTILSYLPDIAGTYLIEEPENGIHPKAIQTIFQSLSSVYNAQILLATHSPVILNVSKIEDILCFAKSDAGVTDIISGKEHPYLSDWKGETSLDVLFASGVLG